jgi:hypothetical protein
MNVKKRYSKYMAAIWAEEQGSFCSARRALFAPVLADGELPCFFAQPSGPLSSTTLLLLSYTSTVYVQQPLVSPATHS